MPNFARLFPATNQFQLKNGALNVSGRLLVYYNGTDDLADIFDENGVQLQQPAILDNNGRARGLFVDVDRMYWMDVQDRYGNSLFTIKDMVPTGGAGGAGGNVDVISTDGSIAVNKFSGGGVTNFDLSIPGDSSEMLEWVETENTGVGDGTVIPAFVDGTMEVIAGSGLFLQANEMYHVTNSFTVTPVGNGINYDTLNVKLMLDSTELCSRSYDVDNSLNDTVECEFSYDVSTTADGYLYWVVSGASAFNNVDAKMQLHRIYSGVAAVPSTYARKGYVDSGLSSKIDYSAIEYNTASQITGISGSAIAASQVDPNEFIPWSASGVFQPSGDYVSATDFSACCSAMSAAVSSVSSDLSSLSGVVSGLTGTYLEQSAFSAYTSTALTGIQQDTADISAAVSAITGQTGNYIDWSASGQFQPSGNYASASDLANYLPNSAIEGSGGKVTGISGSAIKGHEYTGVFPVSVDNTSDTISVANKTLAVDDTMTGYESAGSAIIGVNTANVLSGLTAYQPSGDYAYNSSLSSKLDATASSMFQPSGNYQPSGDYAFNSALTAYQPVSGMTAYAPSGDYADNSALDSKLDASASSDFYPMSGNPSGFLTAHQSLAGYATEGYVDSSVSGKLDATASAQFITSLPPDLAYTSDVASAVSGKLDASASSDFYPMSGNPSGFLTAHQSLAGYATEQYVDSAVSGKLDSSAYNSGDFYSTSNPSGFITGVDLSDYQPVSGMTAYQPAGDYQPSGDYIYASALGTGVI